MIKPHNPSALAYAGALLELGEEQDQLEPLANDAGALREAIDETPQMMAFLRDPSINEDERQKVLDAALAEANPLLKNVVGLMVSRGRAKLLPETLDAFESLLDEKLGKVEVDVTVAEKLDDEALNHVRDQVGEALGREAVVHQYVNPNVIGGLVLRVGDTVVDASVRRQLDAMRERLRS